MSSGPQAVKRPWHAWACRCGVTAARATSGTCSTMGCRRRTSVSGALLARHKHSAHLTLGLLGAWASYGVLVLTVVCAGGRSMNGVAMQFAPSAA